MAPCGLFHMSDGSIFYLFFIIKNFPKINIYIILFFSSISWILYLILPNQPLLIFSYLIIWWAGFEAAKLYLNHKEITYKSTIHINLSLAMMSLIVSLPIFLPEFEIKELGFFPIITFRHFFSTFIIFNIGLIWLNFKLFGFTAFNYLAFLAPISYAIYLIHRPLYRLNLSSNLLVDTILKFVLIFVLAYIIEIILQQIFNKLLQRVNRK